MTLYNLLFAISIVQTGNTTAYLISVIFLVR